MKVIVRIVIAINNQKISDMKTIEDKAKAYDEAIKKAAALYKASEHMSGCNVILETLFPELKESEDEKVKNKLINLIKMSNEAGGFALHKWEADEMLAWIEKQGEHAIYNVPAREVILAIWDLGNEWKELTNGCISTEYGTQLDYIQKHWCESEYYLREKQDEKKPADKEEPKFHEGEWITNGDYIWKILEVKPLDYTLLSQDDNIVVDTISHVDEQFHSFTIEDAKDGDVLLFEGYYNSIVLFQGIGINGAGHINYHCKCDLGNYSFNIQGDVSYLGTIEKNAECFHPATKEQRDLLFQKIKEAGYEWDAEKKELKKFHIIDEGKSEMDYCFTKMMGGEKVSSAWSEEDERMYNRIYDIVHSAAFSNYETDENGKECGEYAKIIGWLKSIKDKVQPKQEWGEEDEEMLRKCINATFGHGYLKECNWLKSLRPQNRWKPSELQLGCLSDAIEYYNSLGYPAPKLKELYEQLKKL